MCVVINGREINLRRTPLPQRVNGESAPFFADAASGEIVVSDTGTPEQLMDRVGRAVLQIALEEYGLAAPTGDLAPEPVDFRAGPTCPLLPSEDGPTLFGPPRVRPEDETPSAN